MKISLSCVLVVALLVGSQGEPIGRTVTNLMQGGQTMVNMMMASGARAIAPVVDAFVQMTQRFMNVGKRYMQHLDMMLSRMDTDPQMQIMAEAMHMNLYDIETAVDALMQNTVWGGEVVKATADCVVPQFESITKVRDDSFRALGTIVQDHKDAIMQLASAGSTIEEQMASLQDHEDKVGMMIANGQGLEAMQYVIKNRQKTEKDGHAMEQVYFGALDEYREATGAALKKMSDTLGKIHEEGEKIMNKLDNCIEPKIMKMIKSEIQAKKNKTGPKHLLPETLPFAHHNRRGHGSYVIQPIARPQYPSPSSAQATPNEQQIPQTLPDAAEQAQE